MSFFLRFLFLLALVLLAQRLWRHWQQQRLGARPPGTSPIIDPLVRCERCGIQVPTSQVPALRAQCRQCGPDAA